MCISYIHTIPQFSFNTILLLHFKFTTIKHVYEQGCMKNIHNRSLDGCEVLEKQISACLFTIQSLDSWIPFDILRQFAHVFQSREKGAQETKYLLWTPIEGHREEKKKGLKVQGARILKRGERTEGQSTNLLSSPAASLCNLLATLWQIVALFSLHKIKKRCILLRCTLQSSNTISLHCEVFQGASSAPFAS